MDQNLRIAASALNRAITKAQLITAAAEAAEAEGIFQRQRPTQKGCQTVEIGANSILKYLRQMKICHEL